MRSAHRFAELVDLRFDACGQGCDRLAIEGSLGFQVTLEPYPLNLYSDPKAESIVTIGTFGNCASEPAGTPAGSAGR